MDTPPGQRVNAFTVKFDRNGRVVIPIKSRGAGTYILAAARPISSPALQGVLPNGQMGGVYHFQDTGR